jgi:hypothetical protein
VADAFRTDVLSSEPLRKGTRVTGPDRARMATDLKNRYDGGESIRALALATGRSYGFIHRILTEQGVTLRGRGGSTRARQVAS